MERNENQATNAVSSTPLFGFQTLVGKWARKTFPKATKESWVKHLEKEVKELQDDHTPEEAADCLILLLGYAHINNFDLMEEAQKKMEINKRRKWGKPDSDGVVEHVRD